MRTSPKQRDIHLHGRNAFVLAEQAGKVFRRPMPPTKQLPRAPTLTPPATTLFSAFLAQSASIQHMLMSCLQRWGVGNCGRICLTDTSPEGGLAAWPLHTHARSTSLLCPVQALWRLSPDKEGLCRRACTLTNAHPCSTLSQRGLALPPGYKGAFNPHPPASCNSKMMFPARNSPPLHTPLCVQ